MDRRDRFWSWMISSTGHLNAKNIKINELKGYRMVDRGTHRLNIGISVMTIEVITGFIRPRVTYLPMIDQGGHSTMPSRSQLRQRTSSFQTARENAQLALKGESEQHQLPRLVQPVVVCLLLAVAILELGLQRSDSIALPTRSIASSSLKRVPPSLSRSLVAKSSDVSQRTPPKLAYSFLLGGCDPRRPEKYRYPLYSLYVALYQLRKLGSTADFYVFVEMLGSDKNFARE